MKPTDLKIIFIQASVVIVILITFESRSLFAQTSPRAALAQILCSTPPEKLDAILKDRQADITELCPTCSIIKMKTLFTQYRDEKIQKAQTGPGNLKSQIDSDELTTDTFGTERCRMGTATFVKQNQKLGYVATAHVHLNEIPKKKIFDTIEAEFSRISPKAVIVEGTLRCHKILHTYMTPIEGLQDETAFLVKLALEKNARILRGEPWKLTSQNSKDVDGFLVLRGIYQAVFGSKTSLHPQTSEELNELFNTVKKTVSENEQNIAMTFEEFLGWYKNANSVPFNTHNVPGDFMPAQYVRPVEKVRRTNRLVEEFDLQRDDSVLATIEQSLKTDQRVLIVYGASHLPRQLRGIEKIFGVQKRPVANCIAPIEIHDESSKSEPQSQPQSHR